MDFNERVGANLQRARKLTGMSQAELARRLSEECGLPFQQQTVLKVEKGARPLKLEEAVAIARLLDAKVVDLVGSDGHDNKLVLADMAVQIKKAREMSHQAQAQLEQAHLAAERARHMLAQARSAEREATDQYLEAGGDPLFIGADAAVFSDAPGGTWQGKTINPGDTLVVPFDQKAVEDA